MLLLWVLSDGLNLTGSRHPRTSRSWSDRDGVRGTPKSRLRPSNFSLPELDVDHMGISVSLLLRLSTNDVLIVLLVEEFWVVCAISSLFSEGSFGKGRFKSEEALRLELFIRSIVTTEEQ